MVQYLLKWEGQDSGENSWEKASDLNCPELIQDFETRAQRPALWKSESLRRKRKSTDAPEISPDKDKGNVETDKDKEADRGMAVPYISTL